jgi:hypothetical protein
MQYELAPAEVLEVADALLFRANALGQDKREQASHLRTLAFGFLGTSTRFKEMASRDTQTLARREDSRKIGHSGRSVGFERRPIIHFRPKVAAPMLRFSIPA